MAQLPRFGSPWDEDRFRNPGAYAQGGKYLGHDVLLVQTGEYAWLDVHLNVPAVGAAIVVGDAKPTGWITKELVIKNPGAKLSFWIQRFEWAESVDDEQRVEYAALEEEVIRASLKCSRASSTCVEQGYVIFCYFFVFCFSLFSPFF
jgi:hypothetical protein